MAIENGSPSIVDREVVDSVQVTLKNENRIIVRCPFIIGNGEWSTYPCEVESSGDQATRVHSKRMDLVFPTSLLLSLLIEATAVPPNFIIFAYILSVFPVLIGIFLKIRTSMPSCTTDAIAINSRVELVSRCLITIFSDVSRKSGNDDCIAKYLSGAIRSMEELKAKFDGAVAPQLLFFLVFRFAKIYVKLGRKHDAEEACEFALRSFDGGRSDMHNLYLATKLLLIRIRRYVEELDWESLSREFIRTNDHSILTLLLTGFIRESRYLNDPELDLKIDAEGLLTGALKRKEETNNDAAKNATIRLTLAMYQCRKESTFSRKACLDLLERAITDFKRVECRCGSHFMLTDYNDELFGAADCPRHQLLADALILQGIVQSQLRLWKGAQASFEEGLILVGRHCTYRQFLFRCALSALNPVESPRHVRSHGSDFMQFKPVINQVEYVSSPRHHLSDAIGECSMSSSAQVELRGEGSEVSSNIVDGFSTTTLLYLFHVSAMELHPEHAIRLFLAIKLFPEVSDILGMRTAAKSCCMLHDGIEKSTRCFMKIVCGAAEKSGGYENIAMYVKRVVEDLKEMHKEACDTYSTMLQVFLIIRCAKVLLRFGSRYKELGLQACQSAIQIVEEHPDSNLKGHLVVGIAFVFSKLHGMDVKDGKWKEYIQFDPLIQEALIGRHDSHCAFELVTSLLTGYLRETKLSADPILHLETVKGILYEALDREKKTNDDVTKQSTIRLTLAKYFLDDENTSSHLVCRTLLKEAISGLRSAECMCPRYCMRSGYFEELFGATECPRHVLLVNALMYEGITLGSNGLMQEAKKSFEEGKSLVERYCNDDKFRLASFNIQLVNLRNKMEPSNMIYGFGGVYLHRSNAPGYDHSPVSTEYQYVRKLAEDMGLFQDNPIYKIVMTDGPLGKKLKEFLSSEVRVQEYVERSASDGDYLHVSVIHTCLYLLFGFCAGYEAGLKKHFCLAVEALDRLPEDLKSLKLAGWEYRQTYFEQLMRTGHIAMLPTVMELDHARNLFCKAYQLTQRKLEELVQLSTEENVVHYFETSKHVCVALATCEHLRAVPLWDIREREEEWMAAVFRSLMWAERGKGGMLSMSFKYGMLQHRVQYEESGKLLDDDFESAFMTDEDFALKFLASPKVFNAKGTFPFTQLKLEQLPPPATDAKKTVFVEYTFINQVDLLIIVMLDGGGIFPVRLNLFEEIDEEIQQKAEEELQKVEVLLKAKKSSRSDTEAWNQVITEAMTVSNIPKGNGSEANGELSKVLSALYTSEVNRAPFNRWIPGMVAGIQRRAQEAQQKRVRGRDFKHVEEEIERLLQKLHAVLIKPIEEILHAAFRDPNPKGDNTIVFVPHEDLGVVPFGALHGKKNSPYLIEQYAISVSPSIRCCKRMEGIYKQQETVLPQVSVADSGAGSPLLVGRRDGYPVSFGPLAEAHKEVDVVGRALGPTSYLKFVDDDTDPDMRTCMKERVMNVIPKASWVHLSVHGEISPQFPQGSLVFGNDDNQRLSAAEIIRSGLYSSTWSARCVIASACQSGLGSVAGGGIMGFARAFMLAGVASCVLSMWEVNQTFCTSFMGKLYVDLRSGKDIGDAVQSTTTSMIRECRQQPENKLGVRRFKRNESGGLPTPERVRKWSILDWAAFSCFGFPGVRLPDSVTVIPGTGTST